VYEEVREMKFDKVSPQVDFPRLEEEILGLWKSIGAFEKSVLERPEDRTFVFYEGPPTANGRPGFHHALSRAFKDLIPRYKTMQGYRVERKGGWDCHGLPVEIQVEKELGLDGKADIASRSSTACAANPCSATSRTGRRLASASASG
jgi:isoleucyl-tRNA synthetase